MNTLPIVEIYTDGACIGNPGPGGWAALIRFVNGERGLCASEADTTNNRMEMMGAIAALESLPCPSRVNLFSDSQYVVKGMTEWLPGWMSEGWCTSAGKPVKNIDLWKRLHAASRPHNVNWRWVKGHAGNPGNERADALANKCAQAALTETHSQPIIF